MKRHNHLWPQVTDFANLLRAAKKARKGKRYQAKVLAFEHDLDRNLLCLQAELHEQRYRPGPYHAFYIVEPKKRLISAAPYRDRVVHHALCNVIQPLFERGFSPDSFANREGFGSHRALRHFIAHARRYRYLLQCDIQKYFANIDHALLKARLRRKLKCPPTLWLADTIIDHANPQPTPPLYFPGDNLLTPLERPKGLPVGNLTSQFFANVYLDGFDHFVKEHLRIPGYVRYVDDFALFGDDWNELRQVREAVEIYLADLRLKIHPVKSQLFQTRHGANFLGFRVLPDRVRVRAASLRRARARLRHQQAAYARGELDLSQIGQSLQSWLAHLAHGDTWRLRKTLLAHYTFVRK